LIAELGWLSQPFIIRLAAKVHRVSARYSGLLFAHPLQPGQRVDLGVCVLGQRTPTRVRVIGVWAQGQDAPWWLATTLPSSPRRVAAYHDRRRGIEEHFRDSKGCRFGLRLEWAAFADSAALSRLFLLVAIARTVWLLAGVLAARADPSVRLVSKSKGPRRSLLAVGLASFSAREQILRSRWPNLRLLWPKATLRNFAW
jgi:hypothetical protein